MEEDELSRICAFIIKMYIKPRCTVTNVSNAPLNDVNFIRALYEYKLDDKTIARSCSSKLLNHLRYSNEKCITFSKFDESKPLDIRKKKIAKKLLTLK